MKEIVLWRGGTSSSQDAGRQARKRRVLSVSMTLLSKELPSDMSVPVPPSAPDPYSQSLSPSPVHDTGSQHCRSISECSHPAFDKHFDEVESWHSRFAGDWYSHDVQSARAAR